MSDDFTEDLLPNDGEPFQTPQQEEVEQENNEERAVFSGSFPIMEWIDEWFDNTIKACDSITNVNLKSKIAVEAQIQAYQMLAELLQAKRGEIRIKAEEYIK